MSEVVCPACGAAEQVDGDCTFTEIGLFRCDACSARFVFGKRVPRVVIEPCRGPQQMLWTRMRVYDPVTGVEACVLEFDPAFADAVADNLKAMSRLAQHPNRRT